MDETPVPDVPEIERPDRGPIGEFLDARGVDGYLLDADGESSDQRYLSGFSAPDQFVTLYADGELRLLVSGLEYGRAVADADADGENVRRLSEFGYRELVAERDRHDARTETIARFLDACDVSSVVVPTDFPLGTADGLRERDVSVTAETADPIGGLRATKTPGEVAAIRRAQRANEASMRAARELLAAAEAVEPANAPGAAAAGAADGAGVSLEGDDPVLVHDGAVLTSERVKEEIEVTLLRHGCALDETIVACGADGAEPHNRGSGTLRANQSIVIDIFPRDKATGYHADMTRTFVVGEPSAAAREFYELTLEAQEAALEAIGPGVTGQAVDDAVSAVYEDAGYPTLRSDPDAETGFIHGTGHGVGLDVHEAPRVAQGGEELRPGHVVTIEPGLYDPAVGGVRIEDFVVVTEDGHENLTEYPKSFEV